MGFSFDMFSSRSTSRQRSRRSPPHASNSSRRPPPPPPPTNEIHRENPIPSSVLGVFGLSQYTTERDLKGMDYFFHSLIISNPSFIDIFQKFGRIKDIQIVIDKKTNKSRGFGFVYFEDVESATRVSQQSVR